VKSFSTGDFFQRKSQLFIYRFPKNYFCWIYLSKLSETDEFILTLNALLGGIKQFLLKNSTKSKKTITNWRLNMTKCQIQKVTFRNSFYLDKPNSSVHWALGTQFLQFLYEFYVESQYRKSKLDSKQFFAILSWYSRVKNGLLPRIRTFREITFFMLCITRIFKSYFECLRLVTLNWEIKSK
jgi:hypothetical protein